MLMSHHRISLDTSKLEIDYHAIITLVKMT